MKTSIIILILLSSFCGFSQNFELKEADTTVIRKMYHHISPSSYNELIYHYLEVHYENNSKMDSVEYIIDSESIFSFVRKFEGGIIYRFKDFNRTEAKGGIATIVFPKTNSEDIVRLVELLQSLNPFNPFNPNKWNEDKTEFNPNGVGCLYRILHSDIYTTVEVICGC